MENNNKQDNSLFALEQGLLANNTSEQQSHQPSPKKRKRPRQEARAFDFGEAIQLQYNGDAYPTATPAARSFSKSNSFASELEDESLPFEVEAFEVDRDVTPVSKPVTPQRETPVKPVEVQPVQATEKVTSKQKVQPVQATKVEPTRPQEGLSDAQEFAADLQAILNGEKTYDAEQKQVVSTSSPAKPEAKVAPKPHPHDIFDKGEAAIPPQKQVEREAVPMSRSHAVFDQMGKNMAHATDFDQGTVDLSLEQRFDEFDRLLDEEESNISAKKVVTPSEMVKTSESPLNSQTPQSNLSEAKMLGTFAQALGKKERNAQLQSYKNVYLIDYGAPGTGHQASAIRVIEILDDMKYKGTVNLAYCNHKTWYFAEKLGNLDNLKNPKESWKLHDQSWKGKLGNINVECIPKPAVIDWISKIAEIKNKDAKLWWPFFWTELFWEKDGASQEDKQKLYNQKNENYNDLMRQLPLFKQNANLFFELCIKFMQTIKDKRLSFLQINIQNASEDSILNIDESKDIEESKTLIIFPALDIIGDKYYTTDNERISHYYKDYWRNKIPTISKTSTHDVMILQPFLWGNVPGNIPQHVILPKKDFPDELQFIPLSNSVEILTYPLKLRKSDYESYESDDILKFIQDQSEDPQSDTVNKLHQILEKAKNKEIYLVSVYYSEDSSSINYDKLKENLINVFNEPDVKQILNKDVQILFLGDSKVQVEESKEDQDYQIKIEYIGRTSAITLIQYYSNLFVTEGANTWQEILTLGTPGISVHPKNTAPWNIKFDDNKTEKHAQELIKNASGDSSGNMNIENIINLISNLEEQDSSVKKYFSEWSKRLMDEESNQFTRALDLLIEHSE